jgi:hypothetical protein
MSLYGWRAARGLVEPLGAAQNASSETVPSIAVEAVGEARAVRALGVGVQLFQMMTIAPPSC